MSRLLPIFFFFFFNDTATTEIYTLSLHDALPISLCRAGAPGDGQHEKAGGGVRLEHGLPAEDHRVAARSARCRGESVDLGGRRIIRSEEHTSELQSLTNLVCRLLLEKKKKTRRCALSTSAIPILQRFPSQ